MSNIQISQLLFDCHTTGDEIAWVCAQMDPGTPKNKELIVQKEAGRKVGCRISNYSDEALTALNNNKPETSLIYLYEILTETCKLLILPLIRGTVESAVIGQLVKLIPVIEIVEQMILRKE